MRTRTSHPRASGGCPLVGSPPAFCPAIRRRSNAKACFRSAFRFPCRPFRRRNRFPSGYAGHGGDFVNGCSGEDHGSRRDRRRDHVWRHRIPHSSRRGDRRRRWRHISRCASVVAFFGREARPRLRSVPDLDCGTRFYRIRRHRLHYPVARNLAAFVLMSLTFLPLALGSFREQSSSRSRS